MDALMPVLYRPHRGTIEEAMREVVEVNDLPQLVRHMRRGVERWYPTDKMPTEANTKVEEYYHKRDERIGWEQTWIVLVDGNAWGFTDGPLGEVAPALVPDHRQDEQDQQDQ